MSLQAILKRLALVVGVLFLALNYVAWVRLGHAGQLPDLNPLGARPDEIFGFRDGLGFEGKILFNEVYRILDAVFLSGLTLLLCFVARALRPKRFWGLIIGFAVIYCIADLTENRLLAELINEVPPQRDVAQAEAINLATRVKFAALLLSVASLITCWRQEGKAG
ncbi:MAG: hypothetical protein AAGA08_16590 [Pseudomonadota bacterium]